VRREIARHAEFTSAVERIIEVNERICEARPVVGGAAGDGPSETGAERGVVARDKQLRSLPANETRTALSCAPGAVLERQHLAVQIGGYRTSSATQCKYGA
jgi:hypothetical protein